MNRYGIFLVPFIMLTGVTLCSSCAKSASASKKSGQQTEAARNVSFSAEKNAASADTAGTPVPLDGTQPASTAAILERQLIKEGSINFETHDITETRRHIESLVQKYGAYISQEDERTASLRIYQYITVRIPKTHFDAFLTDLSGDVKKIDNKSVTVQDVTEEFIDITARLAVKKETEQGYMRLLYQAKTMRETLDIKNQLQELRSEIESIEGRLRYLKSAVNFSTLRISMYQRIEEVSETGSVFAPVVEAVTGGIRAFAVVCIVLLYGWVFIGLGIVAVIVILRLRKRRRKDKAEKAQ